jgi:2-iminobutanoate/2-iminopropanoate deaminase
MSDRALTAVNPSALGPLTAPYSQGIAAGNMVFVAGQVGVDEEHAVVSPGDAGAQTTVAIERIEHVLREAGASLDDVVSATVFLADLGQYGEFNRAWAEKFGDHRPARATVHAELLLDGSVVEIQVIAVRGGSQL